MDESDAIWEKVKNWHIAKVMEFLPQELQRFTAQNKAARWETKQDEYLSLDSDQLIKLKASKARLAQCLNTLKPKNFSQNIRHFAPDYLSFITPDCSPRSLKLNKI
jgi:hypothetical protein